MYKDVIVDKPWGYEYLCYQNSTVAIWMLYIKEDCKTSLHCHPNKHTGLIVLNGEAEVSFLRGSISLHGLEKVHIFKTRFHSTKALSEGGVYLLEVETPEDKHDLLRLEDSNGRVSSLYEGKEFERDKTDDCLWINEPGTESVIFRGCKISHVNFINKEDFKGYSDRDFFVVSAGGVWAGQNSIVLRPSDVVDGVSMNRLLEAFDIIPGSTLIHIVMI